jgi:hypothetical protein
MKRVLIKRFVMAVYRGSCWTQSFRVQWAK